MLHLRANENVLERASLRILDQNGKSNMNVFVIGVAILWGVPSVSILVAASVAALSPRARQSIWRSLAGEQSI
jgi:hypothetical protein